MSESETPFHTTWRNLPDPTDEKTPSGRLCSVRVSASALTHILRKHVLNLGEPWQEILSPEDLARLYGIVNSVNAPGQDPALIRLALALERQAREAIAVPLVLLTRECDEEGNYKTRSEAWNLVTANGIRIVIRNVGGMFLATAYYIGMAVGHNRASRRRTIIREYVENYGFHDWRYGLCPPSVGKVFKELKTYRTDVRMVSLEAWGFDVARAGQPWIDQGTTAKPAGDRVVSGEGLKLSPSHNQKVRGDHDRSS